MLLGKTKYPSESHKKVKHTKKLLSWNKCIIEDILPSLKKMYCNICKLEYEM